VSTKSEPAERGRFVVQAGAYADSDVVRDVRSRLERQGMKTFIQTIEVDGAPRTRVRIGPYATRQEAQEAMARVKALGLAASLISL
jgi:DedD protein